MTVNVDAVRAEFAASCARPRSRTRRPPQALDQMLRQTSPTATGACRARSRRSSATAAAPRARRRALRRVEARQRHRPHQDAARRVLRRRRLQARPPARPHPPGLAAAPVPRRDHRGLHEAQRAHRRARGGRDRPRPGAREGHGQGRRLRGPARGPAGRGARGAGDLLDRTAAETGAVLKSKKGDFVLTLDAGATRGHDVRVVIEAKDRPMSMRAIRDELREAKKNRGAAVGVVVFTPAHAPSGIAPFTCSAATSTASSTRRRPSRPLRGGRPPGAAAGARASTPRGRGRRGGHRAGPRGRARAARRRPPQGRPDIDQQCTRGSGRPRPAAGASWPGSPRPRRSSARRGPPGRKWLDQPTRAALKKFFFFFFFKKKKKTKYGTAGVNGGGHRRPIPWGDPAPGRPSGRLGVPRSAGGYDPPGPDRTWPGPSECQPA